MGLEGATYHPGIPSGKRTYLWKITFFYGYINRPFSIANCSRVNEIAAVGRLAKQSD
jgi:hypothetical protein